MELDFLRQMEYPGRFILIGKGHNKMMVIYGITGRSASSRARCFIECPRGVRIEVTDPEVLKKGNPALLLYDPIRFAGGLIVASNGAQTDVIAESALTQKGAPLETIISSAMSRRVMKDGVDITTYEPDHPNYTPRISAISDGRSAVIHAVRRMNGRRIAFAYPFEPVAGTARFISTYSGRNSDPLPTFLGEPLTVSLPMHDSVETVAREIWNALDPAVRVALAGTTTDGVRTAIVNY